MFTEFNFAEFWQSVGEAFLAKTPAVIASVIILAGAVLLNFLFRLLLRPLKRRISAQAYLVLVKGFRYTIFLIVLVTILQQFGVRLTAILGAAGIAGIAIGFAAQTSLSNFISGLFLIFEKPFQVGDVIRVGAHSGVVESIDLLSLTLRTFDNLAVRIPNETLVKGELINVTRHPIRRYNIDLGIHYREDPDRVITVLKDIAKRNKFVLEEPEPVVSLVGFGESQLNFFVGVWHEKTDFLAMRNSILRDIKLGLEKADIEIPFPHRIVIVRPEDEPRSDQPLPPEQ